MAPDADPVDAAVELHRQAEALRTEGRLAEAETLCREALGRLEETLGPDHPDPANVRNTLAHIRLGRDDAGAAAAQAGPGR